MQDNNVLYGKDFFCTQEFDYNILLRILELAYQMKHDRFSTKWTKILENKTFLMFFQNPSVRTHISFVTAVHELGGHAEYFSPMMTRLASVEKGGESIEDAAKVMSRYVAGVGIRVAEAMVTEYGAGDTMQREFADFATVPVINMASDRYHPCQGLADVMGWIEWMSIHRQQPNYDSLKGKNFLLTWGTGELARGWCSVQEALLTASRFGMNVTIARPDGYDLDPLVYQMTRENCINHQASFRVTDDPDQAYHGAHIVYSRNWVTPHAYQLGVYQKEKEIALALKQRHWITTTKRMQLTDNAIFTHCMPIDRGNEVEAAVASGPRSAVYDIAENRLHVQKAILALLLAKNF